MIKVKSIASGSSGNCYYLTKDNSHLLLEAGVSLKKIRVGTNFNLPRCDGVLISHAHGDHSKFAKDLPRLSVPIYASKGTLDTLKVEGNIVKNGRGFNVGKWNILPFDVKHDAQEPLGFVINHDEDHLVFATDTYYLETVFQGATQFLIECNYCYDLLEKNMKEGRIHQKRYLRTLESHFSLENLIEYFKLYNMRGVKEIRLIHLSNENSDQERMINSIQCLTGVPTYAE